MIALVALLAAAQPCIDVVDRTAGCVAPDELKTAIAPDAKGVEEPRWDVSTLPAELGFVSAGLAFGGGAGLVLGLATTPTSPDERLAQEVATYTGAGLLVWSALVGAGAVALGVFDPSSGALRFNLFGDGE